MERKKRSPLSALFLSLRMSAWISAVFMAVMAVEACGETAYKAVKVSVETITEYYEAVGTVRPGTEIAIEAKLSAEINEIRVRPGDTVKRGDVLITLDSRQLQARLNQAKQGRQAAISQKEMARQAAAAVEAGFDKASSEYDRIRNFHAQRAATDRDLESARAAFLQAQAERQRSADSLAAAEAGIKLADEVAREAEIALGYGTIQAPETAVVLKRLAEPGDLAAPGRPLMILQTENRLRLEAFVREGAIGKVGVGETFSVLIGAREETVPAVVEEIVPYADPRTRTFLVKASLPESENVFPGMFGRLRIPEKEEQVVVIPEKAVRKVGQLELVSVREKDDWKVRYIRTGKRIDRDRVEVLSGLSGNETVQVGEY